jgi:hypothetical protein
VISASICRSTQMPKRIEDFMASRCRRDCPGGSQSGP